MAQCYSVSYRIWHFMLWITLHIPFSASNNLTYNCKAQRKYCKLGDLIKLVKHVTFDYLNMKLYKIVRYGISCYKLPYIFHLLLDYVPLLLLDISFHKFIYTNAGMSFKDEWIWQIWYILYFSSCMIKITESQKKLEEKNYYEGEFLIDTTLTCICICLIFWLASFISW